VKQRQGDTAVGL